MAHAIKGWILLGRHYASQDENQNYLAPPQTGTNLRKGWIH